MLFRSPRSFWIFFEYVKAIVTVKNPRTHATGKRPTREGRTTQPVSRQRRRRRDDDEKTIDAAARMQGRASYEEYTTHSHREQRKPT